MQTELSNISNNSELLKNGFKIPKVSAVIRFFSKSNTVLCNKNKNNILVWRDVS